MILDCHAARVRSFDATPRSRENLSRATSVFRIKRAAQAKHLIKVTRRKQLRHEVNLLDADAVLAGDAAAAGDALVEDFEAGREDFAHLFGIALVEQQHWMNVSVAGMKDVADCDAV